MAVSRADAEKILLKYIRANGGSTSAWYCGITNNIDTRLRAHRVNPVGKYASVRCSSKNCAEFVEQRMQNVRGCAGNPGGGLPNTWFVYVYKKTRTTFNH